MKLHNITNSESKEEKTTKGWDPVFSFLSGKTIISKSFLAVLGERLK